MARAESPFRNKHLRKKLVQSQSKKRRLVPNRAASRKKIAAKKGGGGDNGVRIIQVHVPINIAFAIRQGAEWSSTFINHEHDRLLRTGVPAHFTPHLYCCFIEIEIMCSAKFSAKFSMPRCNIYRGAAPTFILGIIIHTQEALHKTQTYIYIYCIYIEIKRKCNNPMNYECRVIA